MKPLLFVSIFWLMAYTFLTYLVPFVNNELPAPDFIGVVVALLNIGAFVTLLRFATVATED